jgi:cytochrome c2
MAATITLRRVITPVVPALVVLGFFVWFSNWIPQTRWEPPRARAITADMTPADLARVGAILARERGCLACHTIEPGVGAKGQGRGPNFVDVASRRATGVPGGPTDLAAYLTQSLYDPGAYLVEGYANIMPPAHRPPAKFTYEEATAVVDYLMSLGGTPAARVGDLPRPPAAEGAPPAELVTPDAAGTLKLFEDFNCVACHSLEPGEPGEVLVGPPFEAATLREAAAARGLGLEAFIIESVVQPRAFVHGDFPSDAMPEDYGEQLTASQLYALVTYLSSRELGQ